MSWSPTSHAAHAHRRRAAIDLHRTAPDLGVAVAVDRTYGDARDALAAASR
jgi:hypothetical protein